MQHSEFPSDETLSAFIDGRADDETRRRVVEHIASCPECYSIVVAATEMNRPAAEERVTPFRRRRLLPIGLVAAAAAVAIIFFAPSIREGLWPKRGLDKLAEAAPSQRSIEGRLSGFPYRPLAPVTRGADDHGAAANPENWKLLRAAAEVQEAASKNPSVDNLHALGVSHLLLGNSEEAVNTLEEALRKATGQRDMPAAILKTTDAALLNDLSAALQKNGNPSEALDCARRAWSLSPTAESAWNRAVAAEALHLDAQARQAWDDYLRLDRSSPWAAEARSKMGTERSPSPPR